MTIQMLHQWNGLERYSVHTLAGGEESRLIAAGLARDFLPVIDGASGTPFRQLPTGGFSLVAPDGSVQSLARAVELATNVTATGTSRTGAGYFAGIFVSAYNGGPQTITARDSTDNSGRIIGIFTVSATGYYWLDAAAVNSVRITAGVHLTISGGTSRTVCAVVEP